MVCHTVFCSKFVAASRSEVHVFDRQTVGLLRTIGSKVILEAPLSLAVVGNQPVVFDNQDSIIKLYSETGLLLREMNAHIVSPAKEGSWAPGYYYVLCEDPDGIRLEVNFVPGRGVLADNESFDPAGDYKKNDV